MQYNSGYTSHDLRFSVQLGRDFALGSSDDYLILAQTVPSTTGNAGKVNITLTQGPHIRLDYFDSSGTQHSLYGANDLVSPGAWHTIELSETVGAGTGSLTLLVDGSTAVSTANLDTGSQGVTRFAVGDEFTTSDAATTGHLYVDDVTASSTSSSPPATSTAGNTLIPGANTPANTPVPPTATQASVAAPTAIPTSSGSSERAGYQVHPTPERRVLSMRPMHVSLTRLLHLWA
jgi:hypothetical protein